MYNTQIFEAAMNSCGYTIAKIKYTKQSGEVRQVIGTVPIIKKVVIDGIPKWFTRNKQFRWDATGHCFSFRSNVRKRRYDLPLTTIVEWNKLEGEEKNLQ